ncbi:MAG: hypothetical protein HQ581_01665, partial [Planctomycetes bacterium]|nr:hypothetical protein [Planctomycetota bacterium]
MSKTSPSVSGATKLCVAGVTIVLLGASSVFAIPSLQTAFIAHYPELRESQLNSCTTCHMPAKKDFLNGYGLALKDARMDFEKVEELDSDEDGTTNIEEIKEELFPGSQGKFPEYFIFHVNFSE